jgi:2-polyprenyl-3-methyl-5-hydroxy-6-metoxy-1,4-benzoquinol methylase
VAFESLDHQQPWGTVRDNSTNKGFVAIMNSRTANSSSKRAVLDIGCSGGQMVRDFRDMGWLAVGLEGSDLSLKQGRANWPDLAGVNLFTCDAAKPFNVLADGKAVQFDLITAWEVLEHIHESQLPQLFSNITSHLAPGGHFIATTTSIPSLDSGVDLHVTKWTNAEWRKWVSANFPELEPVDIGLKYFQHVRHNDERSFLTYRKEN